ncbi:MAG: hypothetical protein B6I38_07945 [Anaerolineaceae bacterium 4572_5.1]|nr:MAG: hypothetical protein B6I38_07945 [Anaerolineaceae bacterium 4572_5.1]
MFSTYQTAIVRFWRNIDDYTKYVGIGTLVTERYIVTCAHVVNAALGRSKLLDSQHPDNMVNLDFPLLGSSSPESFKAHATEIWDVETDVAILELNEPIPPTATPIPFMLQESVWDHNFRVYGVPEDSQEDTWDTGKLRARLSNSRIEIEGKKLKPGFSGGAVWDETINGIVGIVVTANPDLETAAAHIIPTSLIAKVWPNLPLEDPPEQNGFDEAEYTAELIDQRPFFQLPDPVELLGIKSDLAHYASRLRQNGALRLSGIAGVGKTAIGATLARQVASDEGHIFYLRFDAAAQTADDLIWQLALFLGKFGNDDALKLLRNERQSLQQDPNYQPASLKDKINLLAAGLHTAQAFLFLDDYQQIVDKQEMLTAISILAGYTTAGSARLRLLLAGRGNIDIPNANLPSTEIPDLPPQAAKELLTRQMPDLPADLAEQLWKLWGGNPMRLTYMGAYLASIPADERAAAVAKIKWDDIDQFLVNELFPSLPEAQRRALEWLSLFRANAPHPALLALSREIPLAGGLAPVLESLTRKRIIIRGGRGEAVFYDLHDIMKDSLKNQRDPGTMQREHRIIANFFNHQPNYIESSYHLFKALDYDSALKTLENNKEKLLLAGQVPAALDMLTVERRQAHYGAGVDVGWKMKELELQGEWMQHLGKYAEAEKAFTQIFTLNYFPSEIFKARITRRLGEAVLYQGNLKKAQENLNDSVNLFSAHQNAADYNSLEEGIARYWLGRVYFLQGKDFTKAAEHSARALAIFRQTNAFLRWQLRTENTLATIHFIQKNSKIGIEKLEAIIKRVKRSPFIQSPEAAIVYDNLGTAYYLQQKYQKSIEYYQKSLEIAQHLSWLYQEAKTRSSVNLVYIQLGQWEEASENSQKALDIYALTGDKLGEFYARNGLGIIAHRTGKLKEAKGIFSACYRLVQKQDYGVEQIVALNNLGLLYNDIAEEDAWQQGLDYLDKARELSEEIKNDEFDVETLVARAHIKTKLKQLEGALKDAQQALALAEDWEDSYLIGLSKTALGTVYIELGEHKNAETALKNAIEVLDSDLYEKGRAMLYLGELYKRSGREEDARRQLQNAKDAFEKVDVPAERIKKQMHLNK